jgi:hypothetical protein
LVIMLRYNTTGSENTAIGRGSLLDNTTGGDNTATGQYSMLYNRTGNYNAAFGRNALQDNTSGNSNTALGMSALENNTTASYNTALGYHSLKLNTTGSENAGFGSFSLQSNTTGGSNTALGYQALDGNTTGSNNVAIGRDALVYNTTASDNTAVGYQAGYSNTTGLSNTLIGRKAGYSLTTPNQNTFIGINSGNQITTGANNTLIGAYNGNQNSLDIRTSSNNIVLSDGDGNPRLHIDSANTTRINHVGNIVIALNPAALQVKSSNNHNGIKVEVQNESYVCYASKSTYNGHYYFAYMTNSSNGLVGSISCNTSSTSYNTSSDYRLKENVNYTWDATTRLKQLKPARFNFIADADTTVDGFLAHEAQAVVPEAVTGTHNEVDDDGNAVMQGIDQSKLVPLLVKTIQELEARITALEGA